MLGHAESFELFLCIGLGLGCNFYIHHTAEGFELNFTAEYSDIEVERDICLEVIAIAGEFIVFEYFDGEENGAELLGGDI